MAAKRMEMGNDIRSAFSWKRMKMCQVGFSARDASAFRMDCNRFQLTAGWILAFNGRRCVWNDDTDSSSSFCHVDWTYRCNIVQTRPPFCFHLLPMIGGARKQSSSSSGGMITIPIRCIFTLVIDDAAPICFMFLPGRWASRATCYKHSPPCYKWRQRHSSNHSSLQMNLKNKTNKKRNERKKLIQSNNK